jgi:DNA topoisomerase-1
MRLRRSDLTGPCWRRRRRGRGFSYTCSDGTPLTDEAARARIEALVIPPAWKNVWICPYDNGHIQAVGVDAAGRRQYLYHERWRLERDEQKHERVLQLAPLLPDFRVAVEADLGRRRLGCERVRAVALRMLDRGSFRVGSEEYAEDNGTHGVATLLREHVSVNRDTVELRYPAKGGIELSQQIKDDLLARTVRSLLRSRAQTDRLLVHRVGTEWREVTADDVNERFKDLVGSEFSVKDLRTWHATVIAAVAFARLDGPPESQRGMRRVEAAVMREVAEHLGNTPAVARKSYVDPRVVRMFEQGKTIRSALRRVPEGEVRPVIEQAVVRMLKRAG